MPKKIIKHYIPQIGTNGNYSSPQKKLIAVICLESHCVIEIYCTH